MTRSQAREAAFLIVFEKSFTEAGIEEIVNASKEVRELVANDFAISLAKGTGAHIPQLDAQIEPNLKKWTKNRLSRVSLAALRLAVYEMQFVEDVPVSVSINEAVELTKKYATEEDASFINGVLGSIARAAQVQ